MLDGQDCLLIAVGGRMLHHVQRRMGGACAADALSADRGGGRKQMPRVSSMLFDLEVLP